MKPFILLVIVCLAAVLLVGGVSALTIPGSKSSLQYVPVYENGKLVAYVADFSGYTLVQVSPTRINYLDSIGRVKFYRETLIQQGSSISVITPYETGFTSPYPATWDQTLMKFSSVQYTTYCLEHGIPARGTFAINLPSGAWIR